MMKQILVTAMMVSLLVTSPTPGFANERYQLATAYYLGQIQDMGGTLGVEISSRDEGRLDGELVVGMEVHAIYSHSPLRYTNIDVGDRLIALDGLVFGHQDDFIQYVRANPPGRQLIVDYADVDADRLMRVEVTVARLPPPAYAARPAPPSAPPARTSSGPTAGELFGLGALALGACWALGCFNGGGSAGSGGSQENATRDQYYSRQPQKDEPEGSGNPPGWGDSYFGMRPGGDDSVWGR